MKLIWAIQKMTNQVRGLFYHKQFIKVYFDRSISQEAKAKVMYDVVAYEQFTNFYLHENLTKRELFCIFIKSVHIKCTISISVNHKLLLQLSMLKGPIAFSSNIVYLHFSYFGIVCCFSRFLDLVIY